MPTLPIAPIMRRSKRLFFLHETQVYDENVA
jgi:hypothetical protein